MAAVGALGDIGSLPRSPGIYMMVNLVTGHRMTGLATCLRTRVASHLRQLRDEAHDNHLVQTAVKCFGPDAFTFTALEVIPDRAQPALRSYLRQRELWWALHMGTLDERRGYNLEAGGVWSPAARFRNREQKLLRQNSRKYQLLPGVSLCDPINRELLAAWLKGCGGVEDETMAMLDSVHAEQVRAGALDV